MGNPIILDGKKIATLIKKELQQKVVALKSKGLIPRLAIILIGENPPSLVYVKNKETACRKVGIEVETIRLSANVSEQDVVDILMRCNDDKYVHGIILQMPVPSHLNPDLLLELIDPDKDVDGLTPINLGRLVMGKPNFVPATPAGIVELLKRYFIPTSGRRVVIVGRGELVGKPLANLLLLHGGQGDATVTVCHSKTSDLGAVCRNAEILVAAAGKPGLITGEMVSDGVVVIDAGITRTETGIVGDVDFNSVAPKSRAITPVPGGVGPMTVAMLLANTVQATTKNWQSK